MPFQIQYIIKHFIFLVVFVNNHEKRLKELDTLSSQLGKKVENLTKEGEKLKEIMEGR